MHSTTRRRTKSGVAALASLAAGTALLVGAFPGPASAGGDPETLDGNPDCADLGYPNEFKIEATGEAPDAGTYAHGDAGTESKGDAAGFSVDITYTDDDPVTFDFESDSAVGAVLVKAGTEALAYSYDPPAVEGSGLGSPKDDSISHISFCWGEGGSGGTTTTVPGAPTTTVPADGETPETWIDVASPPATPVTGEPDFTG